MEKKLLVMYVGVAGIRSEDIENFVHKLLNKIAPTTFEGEVIVIPTQSLDTRVECIDPKYITDLDLIKEHTEMMKNLQNELQFQLEQLKKENDEQN